MTIQPLPEDQGDQFERPARPGREPRSWRGGFDLVLFGMFFLGTLIFLPQAALWFFRRDRPELQFTDLGAIEQLVIQGVMNLLLLGFIVFLVRIVHGLPFLQFIHWFWTRTYRIGFLIVLGASLALAVLVVSAFFPPSNPPPIERLLTETEALWLFAIFGIAIAPLFEEVVFRGFLFKVLADLGGPGLAVPASAGLFGLLHIPQLWGSWAGILLIFTVGYVLSLVRQRSNSVIPPFIMHTSYNGLLFGIFALSRLFQAETS